MLYSTAVAIGSRCAARSLAAAMANEERRSVRRCMSLLYRSTAAAAIDLQLSRHASQRLHAGVYRHFTFQWDQILSINTLQTEIEGPCLPAGARIFSGLFAARFAARRCKHL